MCIMTMFVGMCVCESDAQCAQSNNVYLFQAWWMLSLLMLPSLTRQGLLR